MNAAEKLIIKYIGYCMQVVYEARKAGDYTREKGYQKLAINLVSCCTDAHLLTLRENLAGDQPREEGYAEACADLLRQVEADMYYSYYLELRRDWTKTKHGAERHALHDTLIALETVGFVATIDTLQALISELVAIEDADDLAADWNSEKMTTYDVVIARLKAVL